MRLLTCLAALLLAEKQKVCANIWRSLLTCRQFFFFPFLHHQICEVFGCDSDSQVCAHLSSQTIFDIFFIWETRSPQGQLLMMVVRLWNKQRFNHFYAAPRTLAGECNRQRLCISVYACTYATLNLFMICCFCICMQKCMSTWSLSLRTYFEHLNICFLCVSVWEWV